MYIDIFILVVLLWSLYQGWSHGFIKEIISTVGFLVGLLVAATFYSTLGEYLTDNNTQVNAVTNVVAFFILWIIVPLVLGMVAKLLTKTLKSIKLGLLNSLAGAAVSMVKYAILLSCVFNVMQTLRILNPQRSEGSTLFAPTTQLLNIVFDKFDHAASQPTDAADAQKADTLWVNRPATKK
mgnify:CR=1 FL=1